MPALVRDLPPGLASLTELALDLRWTWSHEADALWEQVDAEAWNRTPNPWIILQEIPATRLNALAADGAFVAEVERLRDPGKWSRRAAEYWRSQPARRST